MNKLLALTLIALLASSTLIIIVADTVTASSLPVPQFTVRYIDDSYDVNTPLSIDPFTGESIPATSYHVDHSYIQVSFENNKLPAIPADSHSEYYYNIRYKGQYTNNWIEPRSASDEYYRTSYFKTVNFSLGDISSSAGTQLPAGTKIDFQVQLMYGGIGMNFSDAWGFGPLYFAGETSEWSNTQTVTLGNASSSHSSNPTQTTTQNPTTNPTNSETQQNPLFEFDWQMVVIAGLAVVVVLLVVVVVLQRRRGSNNNL